MTLDIQQIKQRLEERKTQLQEQVSSLKQAQPTPVDPIELSQDVQDFEATAVDFLQMQQDQSTLVNEQALLTEVEDALKRIEEGTYGRCVVCGQPIPEKRLEAIPWAARCVKDQEQLEQSNLAREELYDADTR